MHLNEGLTWQNLNEYLLRNYQKPGTAQRLRGRTPEVAAAADTAQFLRAFVGFPKSITLTGPVTLLRGTSYDDPWRTRNNPCGSWWFPEKFLQTVRAEFERDSIPEGSSRFEVANRLRSSLALSFNLNDFEELWCLRLKPGQQLTGLTGVAYKQLVDSSLEDSLLGMGYFSGGAQQFYFPVIPDGPVTPYELYTLGWR